MQLARKYLLLSLISTVSISYAQRGKDGNGTVNTVNAIVNEYTTLTADASTGNTSITVAASGLNTNSRFSGPLAPGDLIMIIQMQGATINGSAFEFPAGSGNFYGIPNDDTWGEVTNYNNCGNYEFVQVNNVPNSTTISIDCGLKFNYTATGKVQVIRVPRFSTLTVNNPGTIIATNWSGTMGGIVAIEVDGNTIINNASGINVTGQGFRGGALSPNNSAYGGGQVAMPNSSEGADKGEGIAGYQNDYTIFGGRYARGAAANAGGGGDCHNSAGGGGANAGNITGWNGLGNPDNSVIGWTTAWDLEGGSFSTNTSSGGGRGGYSFAATDQDATVVGPWSGAITPWNGDYRRNNGGMGGRPLNYSTGKIFLGGGGGAGDRDNTAGGAGSRGGGLIYLMNYGTISGTGTITANGAAGGNSGIDGSGGGGGGGTVILNSVGVISGISVAANGGSGGNQVVAGFITESEGPGGGGGGGYISVSNGVIGMTANGGANGTSNSNSLTEFPPNGATSGGTGLTNQPITNFTFSVADVTICSGNTAILTATFTGTVPGGTTVNWYSTLVGGVAIGTGNPFTTPILTDTTTYYAETCPGNYRVPVTVTVLSSLTPTISGTTTICSGQSTTLTASGGGTYSWNTGATTTAITVSPVSNTTYTVTANAGGCTGITTVEVTVAASLSPTITGTTTICSGQSTTLTANGGSTYSWNTGETTTVITVSPALTTTYTVTATTSGCTGTTTVQVTVNSLPVPTITGTTTVCTGQNTTLTANGGSTYSWSTGETTTIISVSPVSISTYTLTATTSGCTGSTTVQVTVAASLSPTITGTTAICAGQSTVLTANGGTTYTWNTGETTTVITVSPVSTSTYTLTATTGGCSGSVTAQVTVSSGLLPTISGTTTICSGEITILTANGGSTYSWNTGETTTVITVSPSLTTTYTLTATTSGCTGTTTVQVTVNSLPVPTITGPTTICSGQSTILTANGGSTYSWSTGETTTIITVSPSIPTTYTLTASASGGGCSGSTTVQVIVNPLPVPVISGATTICSAQNVTLTVNGGTTYSWNTGETTTAITVSPVLTTTYTVITNTAGCTASTTAQVIVNSLPTPSITGTTTICNGQSTTLTASGGATYSWNTGETTTVITVSPALATTYTVIATTNGCSGSTTVQVTVNSLPAPTITGTTTICTGNSTTLSTSGGGTYAWNNGSTTSTITITPTNPTTYSVTVTNSGCSGTASQQVIVNPNPVPTISGTTTICSGDVTTLSTSGGGTYLWNAGGATTSAITITPSNTTTYTVTVTNGTCSNTTSQTVTVIQPVVVTITGNNICSGGNAILTANGGATYAWSTGETSSIITVSPSNSTSYTITASTASCIGTASYMVTVDTLPVITISPDVTISYGNNIALNVNGGGTYNWNPSLGLSCTNCANPIASPEQTTQYCVTVTGSGGCSDAACVTVIVDINCGDVFVPNAFSPNNDGENDLECVFGNCIETMTFAIFDRWGEKVFETSDPKQCWDGIYKGKVMNTAVFVYYFEATLITGEQIKKKGNISLVR